MVSTRGRVEALERRRLFAGTPLYLTETVTDAGIELSIDGTPGDDRISIVATVDGLVLANKGGWSTILPDHFVLLRVNAARGNDMLIVDGSVTTDAILHGSNGDDTILGGAADDKIYGGFGRDRILAGAGDDTIVSIGDSVHDRVTGGDGHDSFWTDVHRTEVITDASDDEVAAGAVHRVDAFYTAPGVASSSTNAAPATRDLTGQDLPDPGVIKRIYGYSNFAGRPLFAAAGPRATDIMQGMIGDCYFLAPLSGLTEKNPQLIRNTVVELGDGTYAVRFFRNDAEVFIRIDADLPTYLDPSVPAYAEFGAERSMWVALIEKAFAFFRRDEGTYGSIHMGWMSEGIEALGLNSIFLSGNAVHAPDILDRIKLELDAGAVVTLATVVRVPADVPLVYGHAYCVESVQLDADGKAVAVTLRNPWGVDGGGNDDGLNDGLVTLNLAQVHAGITYGAYAYV